MGGRSGSVGAWVAALSGVALLLVMSALTWYEVTVPAEISTPADVDLTFNAWDAFDVVEYGLLGVALIALVGGLVAATRSGDVAFVAGAIMAAAGAVGLLVLAYRVSDPPTLVVNDFVIKEEGGVEIGAEIGAFLGLVALAGVMVGGWLCLRESGTSIREVLGKLERSLGENREIDQDPPPPQPPAS